MQLFYHPELKTDQKSITFDKTESRHIVRVLRMKEGDGLHVTDGRGYLYEAHISSASDKRCVAEISRTESRPKPWKYHLHIAIAPTKMNERMEWFLEKATEIGIDEITPLLCEHSERKVVKTERLEKVMVSAMKQSLKFQLPRLNPPRSLEELLGEARPGIGLIAHCGQGKKLSLKDMDPEINAITVLIGPEGDFSESEVDMALEHGYLPLDLGASRLRTETAGLVVCAEIAFLKEFS